MSQDLNHYFNYIARLKGAGKSNGEIARRLGWTVERVEETWQSLLADNQAKQQNGYNLLCEQFTLLCAQYEQLGESLKSFAIGIGSILPESELRGLIGSTPEETLENLKTKVIVLGPFTGPEPTLPENGDIGVE